MISNGDVKTAGRTLDLFEAFQAIKKPISLSELASHIGAPVSSCHGLVRTLRNRGYLYSVSGRNQLYPTKRLLNVATVIAAHDPLLEQLGPILTNLRDETSETVILGKRQDDMVVYLEVVEGLHTIRYAAQPGRRVPLHSSAIGKAMLGCLDQTALEKLCSSLTLTRHTSRTITDPNVLVADVAASRERGYFITRGENVEEVMAVAAIVRTGADSFGIALAGPLARLEANLANYAAKLAAACENAVRHELRT